MSLFNIAVILGVPSTSCDGVNPPSGCTTLTQHVGNCSEPSNGLGTCSTSVPPDWFVINAVSNVTVTVSYGGILSATSEATEISLVAAPPWWGSLSNMLASDGVFAVMPLHPKYPGDIFTVPIYARAQQFALISWAIAIHLDTMVVGYVSSVGSSLFTPAVATLTGSKVSAYAIGIQATTASSSVMGGNVLMLTLTLNVSAVAQMGHHRNVVSIDVEALMNAGSNAWVEDVPGYVFDLYNQPSFYSISGCPDLDITVTDVPSGWTVSGGAVAKRCGYAIWTCGSLECYLQVAANSQSGGSSAPT